MVLSILVRYWCILHYYKYKVEYTSSVPISKPSFDFIFVPRCKSPFKLLDAFIYFFPKHISN